MKLASPIVLVSAGILALSPLSAAPISLVNSSFESETAFQYTYTPITGWEQVNSGQQFYGSVTDVSAGFTSGLSGNNALYLTGTLTQLTSATFVTGVTYTLTFDVGNPSNVSDYDGSGIMVGFRNNANNGAGAFIGSGGGTDGSAFLGTTAFTSIPQGTFQTLTVSYTATASDSGNAIRIGGTDYFGGSTAGSFAFDNFQLSDSTSAIPEPSTYAVIVGLMGLGLAAARRRNRA